MTNRRALLSLAFAAAALSAGCRQANMRFVSYKDPYFPEPVTLTFKDCAYRYAPGGDVYVSGCAANTTAEGLTNHYLHVHVYWKPYPGKTYADGSAADAVFTYTVATPRGTLTYVGAGYAFPRPTFGGMDIEVDSGRLRLATRVGAAEDRYGDTRINGLMHAAHDPAAVVNVAREAQIVANRK